MAIFTYTARSKDSNSRSGKLTAKNRSEAKVFLRKRGLKIVSVYLDRSSTLFEGEVSVLGNFLIKNEKNDYQFVIGANAPKSKDIIVFTKQVATMIGSGVPLIQALGVLEKAQPSRGFRLALIDIKQTVENGATLSSAMGKYPKIFDSLYIAMVEAGEVSGNLDIILKKLVVYIEKAEKIKNQVKSAMAYPMIVFFVAIGVVSGLLAFVVPVFAAQFAESGRKLPELTQFVIDISNFAVGYWYILIPSFVGSIVGFYYWIQTTLGRQIFDKYILRAPIIGDVLRKIAVGRFCSTMSSMLSSGVNLLQALTICASSAGNKTIEYFILNVKTSLEKGQNFSTPLAEGDLFPTMVVSMVQVGESTGSLDDMLTKVSELYEEEVDNAVKTMLSMIEPIMIAVLGGLVAFVVIAMYLPVFEMAGGVE